MAQVVEHLPSKYRALCKYLILPKKKESKTGCWWLTPVILATQEAEIRRIKV
jgi:hypothetical protein